MKKVILLLLAIVSFINTFAQSDYKKRPSLGVHFFLNDFQTATDIRARGLADVIKTKSWTKIKSMSPGLALTYMEGLGSHIDFLGSAEGSFVDYPVPGKALLGRQAFLLEATAAAALKLCTDKYWLSPYLTLGAGASSYSGYFGAFVPAGVGVQCNLFDQTYLMVNSQYRIPITENAGYHLFYSVGITGSLTGKKEIAPTPLPPVVAIVEPPKDRDGDGILDKDDKCPDVKGIASLQGCPDKDGDGITDAEDQCPDVAGLSKYKGCPIPDADKDGINDEVDKCPTVFGVARYQGCPVPDTDGDGVNDEDDKCPNEKGAESNYGCPEIAKAVVDKINIAAQNIFFATGSSKLLATSFKSLNDVAKILTENPSYKLDIDGHTDNTGQPEKNQVLSESRAKAVLDYLKSKGIDDSRMNATGYGPDRPIADNKTPAGRAKNRRVEMKARNY